jgi:hypothetical protein
MASDHGRPATRQKAISAPSCDKSASSFFSPSPTHLDVVVPPHPFHLSICHRPYPPALAYLQYRPANTFSALIVAEPLNPACGSASHLRLWLQSHCRVGTCNKSTSPLPRRCHFSCFVFRSVKPGPSDHCYQLPFIERARSIDFTLSRL